MDVRDLVLCQLSIPSLFSKQMFYGIKMQTKNDPYIQLAEDAFAAGSSAANAGSYLVDVFPLCKCLVNFLSVVGLILLYTVKYVPEWMPGAVFKRQARIWKELITRMPIMPYDACKKTWVRVFSKFPILQTPGVKFEQKQGNGVSSFAATALEHLSQQPDVDFDKEEIVIRNTAATTYGAASDTVGVILLF